MRRIAIAMSLLLAGCQALQPAPVASPAANVDRVPETKIQRVSLNRPEPLEKTIPLTLDAVLRLASDQNGQVQIARAKLAEAFADQEIARKRWLPDLSVGASYYRHEGGIQDFQGNLVHSSYGSVLGGMELRGKYDWRDFVFQKVEAERALWQRKGELSKLTSDNLLDAASTYVDLLAARTALAISEEAETKIADLLERAKNLARVDEGQRVEATRAEAELGSQRAVTRKLREGMRNGSAKLTYLLGMDPSAEIEVADRALLPVQLADATQPLSMLVEGAVTRGPGVREVEALLLVIEEARQQAAGPGRLMPTVEVNLLEGAFGAGPGSNLAWDNRWDLGVHLRWKVGDAWTARERRRQTDARVSQAQLTYHDLRAKLTLGVREARETALSGLQQLKLSEEQVRSAEESYRLSEQRFQQNIKGRSISEVLLSLRVWNGARLEAVQAVRELNKAQLRLFVLAGAR
jgi:outer membrane protein TolC